MRLRFSPFSPILFLSMALLSPSVRAQESYSLSLNLMEGKVYPLQIRVANRIRQTVDGMEQGLHQNLLLGYEFAVDRIDPSGNADITVTYVRTAFTRGGPTGPVEYDSLNPPSEDRIPLDARGFAFLKGKSFQITLTPRGRITRIDGVSPLLDQIVERFASETPDVHNLRRSLQTQFGDEAIRESLERVLGFFPDGNVAIQNTWSRNSSLRQGIPMEMATTWKLESIRNGVAKISQNAGLTSPAGNPPVQLSGIRISYEFEGTQTGEMELDLASGWPLKGTFEQRFSGEVRAQGVPRMPTGTTWPLRSESSISITGPASR